MPTIRTLFIPFFILTILPAFMAVSCSKKGTSHAEEGYTHNDSNSDVDSGESDQPNNDSSENLLRDLPNPGQAEQGNICVSQRAAREDGEAPGPKNSLAFKFRRIFVPPHQKGRAAEFLITNRFAKDIVQIGSSLEYLDRAGQLIDYSAGWGVSFLPGFIWCGPGDTIIDNFGTELPDNVAEVRVVVQCIKFRDGTESYPLREKAAAHRGEVPAPKNSLECRFEQMVVSASSGRMAEFLITNHFDKDVFEIELTVEYMDQSGQQIGSYPFSVQGNFALCKVGDTILYKLGYQIPKKATKARVVVHRLKFRDSTEWKP